MVRLRCIHSYIRALVLMAGFVRGLGPEKPQFYSAYIYCQAATLWYPVLVPVPVLITF